MRQRSGGTSRVGAGATGVVGFDGRNTSRYALTWAATSGKWAAQNVRSANVAFVSPRSTRRWRSRLSPGEVSKSLRNVGRPVSRILRPPRTSRAMRCWMSADRYLWSVASTPAAGEIWEAALPNAPGLAKRDRGSNAIPGLYPTRSDPFTTASISAASRIFLSSLNYPAGSLLARMTRRLGEG